MERATSEKLTPDLLIRELTASPGCPTGFSAVGTGSFNSKKVFKFGWMGPSSDVRDAFYQ